jgi:hypothetical protein
MKKTLAALAAAAGLFAAGIVVLAGPAQATIVTPPGEPSYAGCQNLNGWYVNPDEADRKPTPGEKGLVFSGDDLIHHAITLSTDTLTSGAYTASPAPDQPSFFSVEVRDSDGSGYATLRWNASSHLWDMTTGGQTYSNANPTALVLSKGKSKNVFSFGVGYTKNPPGTVTTTVASVSFNGQVWKLDCPRFIPSKPVDDTVPPGHPVPSTSATVTTPPTVTPSESTGSPEPDESSSDDPIVAGAGGSEPTLPVTGPRMALAIAGGAVLIGTGVLVLAVTRRRKVTFTG